MKSVKSLVLTLLLIIGLASTSAAMSEDGIFGLFSKTKASSSDAGSTTKVAYNRENVSGQTVNQAIADANALVFSAPPRETPDAGEERYLPVAEYLGKVLGRKVIYKHPGTWGVYRTEMLKGNYDIVFDGPHFNSYRMENLGHNILVKMELGHEFVIIKKKGEDRYKTVDDLAGRSFCTHAPPNLGTLVLLRKFDNPSRQPVIQNTKGWKSIYEGVTSGKCLAGILPIANLEKFDPSLSKVDMIYRHKPLPNQAFSAGPRITTEEQAKVAKALLAPAAKEPTAKLRSAFNVGDYFISATNQEYVGLSEYLKSEWGYY